ncbi:MAG: hypothetical protein C7K11_00920 [Candidatus Amulumruptor caecigallinarius]|nr:MAG: hypothetical protein C7K11_00920 [Candidatus Amulumruptor caecigallinarius]
MKISKIHSLLATLFVGLASMSLASCGSDDDDEPSGPATNPAYDNPALYKGTTTINEVNGAFEQAESSQTTDITYTVDFNLSTNTLTVTCNNFKVPGFDSMPAMVVQFPDIPAVYDGDNFTFSAAAVNATAGGRPASEMVTITDFEGSGKVGSGATLSVQYRCAVKGSVNKTFMVRASKLLP